MPILARDGDHPFVASVKWGSLSGRWRERYSAVCEACFDQTVPCPHYLELPLRLLIVGHNPSEHAFTSGYAYSNPTNRMLALLNGTFGSVSPWPSIMPADWTFMHQNWLPLHKGVGLTDLGTEPGNDAAAYKPAVLLRWRDDMFVAIRGHLRRVGDTLVKLWKAASEPQSEDHDQHGNSWSEPAATHSTSFSGHSSTFSSSDSTASQRPALDVPTTALKARALSKKRAREAPGDAYREITSSYFSREVADEASQPRGYCKKLDSEIATDRSAASSTSSASGTVHSLSSQTSMSDTASVMLSSRAFASSNIPSSASISQGPAIPNVCVVASSFSASPRTVAAAKPVDQDCARKVLDVVARLQGLHGWQNLKGFDLHSTELCSPRYVSFAGKAEWKMLFSPPLR